MFVATSDTNNVAQPQTFERSTVCLSFVYESFLANGQTIEKQFYCQQMLCHQSKFS